MNTYRCQVLNVDPNKGYATVRLENGQGIFEYVLIGQTSANPVDGGGDISVPRKGNIGYVSFPTDGSRPFFFGEIMPLEADGKYHAGGRYPDLNPGDRLLTSNNRSYICLRDSGVIEIGSTPLSSFMLFPTENLIRSVFGNLEMVSPLGALKWKEGKDGSSAMVWFINEKSGGIGGMSSVTIKAGNVSDGAHPSIATNLESDTGMLFECIVGPEGKVFGYHIDAIGQASMESDSNVFLGVRKSWEGRIGERAFLDVGPGGINVNSRGDIIVTGPGGFELTVDSKLVMSMANIHLDASNIRLGRGGMSPVARVDKLIPILVRLCESTGNWDLLDQIPLIASDCVEVS